MNILELIAGVLAGAVVSGWVFAIVVLTVDEVVARSTSLSIAFGRRR